MVQRLRASLPMKSNYVVVAKAFSPEDDHLLDYSARQVQLLGKKSFGSSDIIHGNSIRGTLELLEQRGIDRQHIPVTMGGDYFYHQKFDDWVRTRLSLEDAMIAAPPIRNTATANAATARIRTLRRSGTMEGMIVVVSSSDASAEGLTTDAWTTDEEGYDSETSGGDF